MNLLLSRTLKSFAALSLFILSGAVYAQTMPTETKNSRPRAREIGLKIGVLPTGALNAITDVAGVRVGHAIVFRGENVRTGVTAVLPHAEIFSPKKCRARFSSETVLAS
jgi:D-aminopeptidase